MKKSKPEHRREYWKFHVAAHSFEMAKKVVSHLNKMQNTEAMFYPLMISLHAFYARPFRHSKRSRNVPISLVPDGLLSVHDMLLQLRDKIFAHHDKESKITDSYTGIDLFQLIVVVANGEMRPAVQTVFPTDFQLGEVHKLTEHLYRICMHNAHKALIRCVGDAPDEGTYRVSADFEGRAPLLIRSELISDEYSLRLKETKRRMPR